MLSRIDTKIKVAAILIGLISIIVYLPALQNDFVNLDDDTYIYENPDITSIDTEFIKWTFTTFKGSNWHPLTWLSHAVDYSIWELNPLGHHLTSIILHGLNSFLVVMLIAVLITAAGRRKEETDNKGVLIASAVTGLLFALHPVHVESVAWVSERKDVLCAFFFLLSILSYIKYVQGGKRLHGEGSHVTGYRQYGLSLLFFILALMSKPMAVTLPVVLLILDKYPLNRTEGWTKLLTEKIPFFLLSAASSAVTVTAQMAGGAIKSPEQYPFWDRLQVVIKAPVFYLYKMLWPAGLAPLYPYPMGISFLSLQYTGATILVVLITAYCVWSWKKQKIFASVWAYYLVTLLPVIGIVQVGGQAAADRYTYLPGLGPFVLAGLGASYLWEKACSKEGSIPRALSASAVVVIVIILFILPVITVKQAGIWKDPFTLWNTQIDIFPEFYWGYIKKGQAYDDKNNYRRGIIDYDKSIKLNPFYARTYLDRGDAYGTLGEHKKAIKDFNTAIMISPDYTDAYTNRGIAYLMMGNYQRALNDLNKAIELDPEEEKAYFNRILAYKLAIKDLNRAIKKNPESYELYINRGSSFAMIGQFDKAIEDFNKAIAFKPEMAIAFFNRGLSFNMLGDNKKALNDFQSAARLGDKEAQDYLKAKGLGW